MIEQEGSRAPSEDVGVSPCQIEEFFSLALERYDQASLNVQETSDRCFIIGQHRILFRFAGPAMLPLIAPAFEHLPETSPSSAELTICVWDSASTGVSMPPPPWILHDILARGEIQGFSRDPIRTAFHLGSNTLSVLHKDQRKAIFWISDAACLPYYESAKPFRTILHWWMESQKEQLIHASAVGRPEGGVLMVGAGGAGKSTSALACLDSELKYLGDDHCLLTPHPEPHAYSLYNSVALTLNTLEKIPTLKKVVTNQDRLDSEKALIFLKESHPQQLISGFPIRALFLPRVSGQTETTLTQISSAQGLMGLAPSTIFQLPGAGPTNFQLLGKVVRKIPCFRINVGTRLAGIPEIISKYLDGI